MKIRILSSCYSDLKRGRAFYEKQGEGLGGYFFDSVFSDIDSLILYAGIHKMCFGYYRLLASRFPYAIYYKIKEDSVLVYRVFDCRSNPQVIKSDLKK